MPYQGTLTRVKDNAKGWSLLIDVDDKGEHWFTLWDRKFAGESSKENEALCDVHQMIGERVIYSAVKGKLKDPKGPDDGERWNAVIESIILETVDIKSVREMAKEIAEGEAKNEALVSSITNEVQRKASESDSEHECEQTHAVKDTSALSGLTIELISSLGTVANVLGNWTNEIQRLLDKEA